MARAKVKSKQEKTVIAPEDIKAGMVVRVHQKITETTSKGEPKTRTQVFEGVVLARRGGKQQGATFTVRKVSQGVGVERIFPLYSPNIQKIELVKQYRLRRAKAYYLRSYRKKLKEVVR